MANIKNCESLDQFNSIIEEESGILFYFSHEECNVCKVLKPKIAELLTEKFPSMSLYYCDTVKTPEIAGQNSIFAVPTILVYFEGREYIRVSRNISIESLENQIDRYYSMVFE
ncbi:MAG: thioredoxin family protein [Saprospiraceae bacterium]